MTLGIVFCDPFHRKASVKIFFYFMQTKFFKIGEETLLNTNQRNYVWKKRSMSDSHE